MRTEKNLSTYMGDLDLSFLVQVLERAPITSTGLRKGSLHLTSFKNLPSSLRCSNCGGLSPDRANPNRQVLRMIDEQGFPRPIKLSVRANGWIESEVSSWIREHCAQPREELSDGRIGKESDAYSRDRGTGSPWLAQGAVLQRGRNAASIRRQPQRISVCGSWVSSARPCTRRSARSTRRRSWLKFMTSSPPGWRCSPCWRAAPWGPNRATWLLRCSAAAASRIPSGSSGTGPPDRRCRSIHSTASRWRDHVPPIVPHGHTDRHLAGPAALPHPAVLRDRPGRSPGSVSKRSRSCPTRATWLLLIAAAAASRSA